LKTKKKDIQNPVWKSVKVIKGYQQAKLSTKAGKVLHRNMWKAARYARSEIFACGKSEIICDSEI